MQQQQFESDTSAGQMRSQEAGAGVTSANTVAVDPQSALQSLPAALSASRSDRLLAKLKRHTRLQKLFRLGAFVLGVPAILFFAVSLPLYWWPSLALNPVWNHVSRFLGLLTFHSTIQVTVNPDTFQPNLPTGTTLVLHGPVTLTHYDLITPLLLTLGCLMLAALARRQRGRITRTLADQKDVRAVGPLAEALGLPDRSTVTAASIALINLLPQLKATDAGLLNTNQRACLHRALSRNNLTLSHAILTAFQQVGNSRDLPIVERLTQGRAGGAKTESIRQAAEECVPFLRRNIEQEQARQTLLRAASPENTPDTLLRAVQATPEADPQHLLRASTTDPA